MRLFEDAEVWIAIGLLVFVIVLIRAKVPGLAMKALDDRAAKIQAELDEALRLREEAQALLASIKTEREAAERLGREIIANAEADAKRMRAEAQARLEDQIERCRGAGGAGGEGRRRRSGRRPGRAHPDRTAWRA